MSRWMTRLIARLKFSSLYCRRMVINYEKTDHPSSTFVFPELRASQKK